MRPRVVGVVLAGGKSKRMGQDKSVLPRMDGQDGTWLGRAVDCLRSCTEDVWIAGKTAEELSSYPDLNLTDVRQIPDLRTDIGPLAGVEAALAAGSDRPILTLPCDLPNMESDLLLQLLQFGLRKEEEARDGAGAGDGTLAVPDGVAEARPGAGCAPGAEDFAAPCCFSDRAGHLEPAVALYPPMSLVRLKKFIDGGGRSVARFLQSERVRLIEIPDGSIHCFCNLNTPEQLSEFRPGEHHGP